MTELFGIVEIKAIFIIMFYISKTLYTGAHIYSFIENKNRLLEFIPANVAHRATSPCPVSKRVQSNGNQLPKWSNLCQSRGSEWTAPIP